MGGFGGKRQPLSSVPIYISLLFTVKEPPSIPGFPEGMAPPGRSKFRGVLRHESQLEGIDLYSLRQGGRRTGRRRDESTLSYFTTKAALAATEAKREDPGKEGACPSWKNGDLSEALGEVSCQVVKPDDGNTGLLPRRRGWAATSEGKGRGCRAAGGMRRLVLEEAVLLGTQVGPAGWPCASRQGAGAPGPGEERWGAEESEAKSLTAPLLALGLRRSGVRLPSRWTLRGDSGRSGGQEDSGGGL